MDWTPIQNRRFDYPLTDESVVLDIGGYQGDFAARIYETFGCFVHIFEPVPQFIKIMENRFRTVGSKVCLHEYGVGGRSGQVKLHGVGDAMSRYKEGADWTMVQIRDIVNVMHHLKEFHHPSFDKDPPRGHGGMFDLIKINIEGEEFPLLFRMLEAGLVSQFKFLQIQYHQFYPNALELASQITLRLEETHRLMWSYPFMWESWVHRGLLDDPDQAKELLRL